LEEKVRGAETTLHPSEIGSNEGFSKEKRNGMTEKAASRLKD